MKTLKDLLGLRDYEADQSELERSAKFWKALMELAEDDLDIALKLNDDGFVETATERIDLAETRLEAVYEKLKKTK